MEETAVRSNDITGSCVIQCRVALTLQMLNYERIHVTSPIPKLIEIEQNVEIAINSSQQQGKL